MNLLINNNSYVIFDLDDTLYAERSYVKSAFRHIDALLARYLGRSIALEMIDRFDKREDVFEWLLSNFQLPADKDKIWLLHEYRTHEPTISLGEGAKPLLEKLRAVNVSIGLMTDGRSITQRHKIAALGLNDYLSDILISEEFGSEKPDPRNYQFFSEKYPGACFTFVGDNTRKDFIVPARLGWQTICLKCSGSNIHPQDFSAHPRPDHIVTSLAEIEVSRASTAGN